MVEIFKTNVSNKKLAGRILRALQKQLPAFAFNFDLEDCDRILRAQGESVAAHIHHIIGVVKGCNAEIAVYED